MHIVLVYVHVLHELVDKFIEATKKNADLSRKEGGIIRFDIYQQKDDQNKFVLLEIYKTPEDQIMHKKTDHYVKWRDAVANMMAEPRMGVPYTQVY